MTDAVVYISESFSRQLIKINKTIIVPLNLVSLNSEVWIFVTEVCLLFYMNF